MYKGWFWMLFEEQIGSGWDMGVCKETENVI